MYLKDSQVMGMVGQKGQGQWVMKETAEPIVAFPCN